MAEKALRGLRHVSKDAKGGGIDQPMLAVVESFDAWKAGPAGILLSIPLADPLFAWPKKYPRINRNALVTTSVASIPMNIPVITATPNANSSVPPTMLAMD